MDPVSMNLIPTLVLVQIMFAPTLAFPHVRNEHKAIVLPAEPPLPAERIDLRTSKDPEIMIDDSLQN